MKAFFVGGQNLGTGSKGVRFIGNEVEVKADTSNAENLELTLDEGVEVELIEANVELIAEANFDAAKISEIAPLQVTW
ncbi:MAG: hypothetical protein KGQ36_00155 [Rickettsiales bacterium]|nr:hypothetical protein [Rickettsiales bacterium]